jgi:hypothetical protein
VARDRNDRTSTDQTKLQASLIRQKYCAILLHLLAGLGFRQAQVTDGRSISVLDTYIPAAAWALARGHKDRTAINMRGVMLKICVASEDCESEQEAEKSAQKPIRQI